MLRRAGQGRALAALAACAIGLASGGCRHPRGGGERAAGGACRGVSARCAAAAECCSNRCDFSRGTGAAVCTSPDELDGPLAGLSTERKRGDLRLVPPQVLDVAAIAGPAGSSVVQVRFADDARLGRSVTLAADDGPLALHDDGIGGDAIAGDHVYSAVLAVPFDALLEHQRAVLAALERRKLTEAEVFDGPELVGRRPIEFQIDPARIHFFDPPVPAFSPARTLTVTDLAVVEDPGRTFNPCTSVGTPMGAWTFGHLASELANQAATGVDPADLVLDWLLRWDAPQDVNGFTVGSRKPIEDLIAAWPKVAATGKLDLARAPMKLLAIVNRSDLAGNPSYGHVGGAEGRFVVGVLGPTCAVKPFTVIFEYGVPRRTCSALRDWAAAWVALDAMTPGSAAYNGALAALTDVFVHANADPGKLLGSALDQLRTDENALFPSGAEVKPWQLREFTLQLTGDGVRLREATVKQTPDERFNAERGGARAADLATWINANQPAILAGSHTVPDLLPFPPGDSFLGGATLNFFTFLNGMNHRDYWTAPGIASNDARHKFSLATCNGCHGEETRTGFLHIGTAAFGTPAGLSGFLTGETIPDPVVPATTRTFHELAARAIQLAKLAGATCSIRGLPNKLGGASLPLPPITLRPTLRAH